MFTMKSASWIWLAAGGLVVVTAGVLAYGRWPRPSPKTDPVNSGNAGPQLPGIRFTDVTDSAGIRFRHVSGITPKKLLPETMGAGVAVIDFDQDGKPDLFFANSRPWPGQPAPTTGRATQALYRNLGEGKFEDVTSAFGLDLEFYGMGVAVGDYDNDGWPDLFVTAVGGNRLFHNAGGKRFEEMTILAGLGEPLSWPNVGFDAFLTRNEAIPFPSSTAFVDYDGDGALDLFVCNYLTWSPAADVGAQAVLPGGTRAYVPPQQFNGAHAILYRNLGGGKFQDVSANAGVQVAEIIAGEAAPRPIGKALGVVVCDPDNDGWPDLVVANDTVRNLFFHNVPDPKGGRRFQENGLFAGLAYADGRPRGGMGIDSAEVMPDDLAVVIANFSNEPNSLFRRLDTKPIRFADTAPEVGLAGVSRYPMKFGAMFFDCDRDGRPDLFVANGHLEPDIELAQPGQTHAQRAQLFWNTGDKKVLLSPADADMFPPMVGRGCAYLDFDGDGDLDVVITDNNGRARLFRNDTDTSNRAIRLVLKGKTANRDAIGATVEVESKGVVRRLYHAPTRGYLSQSEATVTVGLGTAAKADRVSVRWPRISGAKQEWQDLEGGKTHVLTEGDAKTR